MAPWGESGTVSATGNRTVASPKITANFSASYLFNLPTGNIEPTVNVSYNDGFFFYADNRLIQPAYWMLNASVAWHSPGDTWTVQGWGKNLTNETYYEGRSEQGGLGDAQRQAAPPHLWGGLSG